MLYHRQYYSDRLTFIKTFKRFEKVKKTSKHVFVKKKFMNV